MTSIACLTVLGERDPSVVVPPEKLSFSLFRVLEFLFIQFEGLKIEEFGLLNR